MQTIDRRKIPSRKCKNASKSRDDQITNQVSTQKSKSSSNITSHAGKSDNLSVLLRPLDINSSQLSNGTNIKKNSARRIDDIKETNTEDQQERSCKNTLYSQRGRLCKPNSKYYNKDFTWFYYSRLCKCYIILFLLIDWRRLRPKHHVSINNRFCNKPSLIYSINTDLSNKMTDGCRFDFNCQQRMVLFTFQQTRLDLIKTDHSNKWLFCSSN